MNKEQAAALRKPFPPSAIGKLPKAGIQLDYVGHAATTDRLLSVDPDWTWEPAAVDDQGLPVMGPGRGMWIKLTVCGVTRYGYGDGATVKEIIGDAIRNAAMRFGVALDLWSKEELEQVHGPAIQTSGAGEVSPESDLVVSSQPSSDTPASEPVPQETPHQAAARGIEEAPDTATLDQIVAWMATQGLDADEELNAQVKERREALAGAA